MFGLIRLCRSAGARPQALSPRGVDRLGQVVPRYQLRHLEVTSTSPCGNTRRGMGSLESTEQEKQGPASTNGAVLKGSAKGKGKMHENALLLGGERSESRSRVALTFIEGKS